MFGGRFVFFGSTKFFWREKNKKKGEKIVNNMVMLNATPTPRQRLFVLYALVLYAEMHCEITVSSFRN